MKPINRIGFLVLAGCALVFWSCGGGGGGSSAPTAFTISGTIQAAAGNQVDSDVNDTGTVPVTNSRFEEAQAITAPGVIGGYINAPGEGEDGNSYLSGDPSDFFRVALEAGTTIRLALPDDSSATVALTLHDINGIQVAGATSITRHAALMTEASGTYSIQVRIVSGATAYQLIVGTVNDLPGVAPLGQSSDFVPGEVLVQLKQDPTRQAAGRAAMSYFARRTGLKTVSTVDNGWMRLRAEDRQAVFQRLNLPRSKTSSQSRTQVEEIKIAKEETLRLVQALRRQSDVAHAQPNFIRRPYFTPNDPLYPLQWHLPMLHLPDAWDRTLGSADVIVAVIDTGILSNHPDIAGKIVNGYDFISDLDNAADGGGSDPNPEDVAGSDYHGTHAAGTIAASFDNGIGVTGIGGATRIMPVRVLGPEGGTDWDIANAIRWAAGYEVLDEQGNPIPVANPPADIINMSLGGAGYSERLEVAVIDAYNAGVIMFAAAGNTPDGVASYPAAFAEVFSVGAVDANGEIAYYSNFGETVFVTAPGGDIGADVQPDGYADGVLSTLGSDLDGSVDYQYGFLQGTSMATANMSGVAALMVAARAAVAPANPLRPDEIHSFLANGWITADLGAVGDDDFYGYGLIDAYQAVLAAEAGAAPPALSITPLSLRFGPDTTSATIYARPVGSDPLFLNNLTVGPEGWLSVVQSAGQSDVGDFGQYTVTVNRTNQPGGIHTDFIEFESSANTVRIPVTMEVLPDPYASAGIQYLLLINTDTDEVTQQALSPSNGQYSFVFTGIPPGNYELVSGSDLDNDYSLLDEGEAVGFYRSVNDRVSVRVDRNLTGLNFIASFQQWSFLAPSSFSIGARREP